jgi:hypothetical protein
MGIVLDRVGQWLGRRLSAQRLPATTVRLSDDKARLHACLRPGDVVLVEGHTRVSAAIKYLTQSTWSHAALYVGHEALGMAGAPAHHRFVEADIVEGVRSVGPEEFNGLNTRICRPAGLDPDDCRAVVGYAISRIGYRYDLRNIFDLARYLFPTPPVPERFRRRMLTLGSGDPTRAICSTLIAQAFQAVRYPILPEIERIDRDSPDCPKCVDEVLHLRHHSLFVPRDFDLSPYFNVVKPELTPEFDYRRLHWADDHADARPSEEPRTAD